MTGIPKKPGRKPLGDRPLTNVEKQRRRRENLRSKGLKCFEVWAHPEMAGLFEKVNEQVLSSGDNQQYFFHAVTESLSQLSSVLNGVEWMENEGHSLEDRVKYVEWYYKFRLEIDQWFMERATPMNYLTRGRVPDTP